MNKKIAIIGGGNLGVAIAEGLIKSGFCLPSHIIITKRNIKTLADIETKGVMVTSDNNEAIRYADLVILAAAYMGTTRLIDNLYLHLDEKTA